MVSLSQRVSTSHLSIRHMDGYKRRLLAELNNIKMCEMTIGNGVNTIQKPELNALQAGALARFSFCREKMLPQAAKKEGGFFQLRRKKKEKDLPRSGKKRGQKKLPPKAGKKKEAKY